MKTSSSLCLAFIMKCSRNKMPHIIKCFKNFYVLLAKLEIMNENSPATRVIYILRHVNHLVNVLPPAITAILT